MCLNGVGIGVGMECLMREGPIPGELALARTGCCAGDWYDDANGARSAARNDNTPSFANSYYCGFRLARGRL